MKNIQADGTAEDLIRAFVQVGCAEIHCKTLIEKFTAQLDNGLVEMGNLEKHAEMLDDTILELDNLAELRRALMKRLFDMYDGDKNFWCMVKHLGVGAYTLFEAYQSSEDDVELYALALEANRRFIKALTYFLGQEITECAACFSDALNSKTFIHEEGDIKNDVSV